MNRMASRAVFASAFFLCHGAATIALFFWHLTRVMEVTYRGASPTAIDGVLGTLSRLLAAPVFTAVQRFWPDLLGGGGGLELILVLTNSALWTAAACLLLELRRTRGGS